MIKNLLRKLSWNLINKYNRGRTNLLPLYFFIMLFVVVTQAMVLLVVPSVLMSALSRLVRLGLLVLLYHLYSIFIMLFVVVARAMVLTVVFLLFVWIALPLGLIGPLALPYHLNQSPKEGEFALLVRRGGSSFPLIPP